MMITYAPREEILTKVIRTKLESLKAMADKPLKAHEISNEPASALFTEGYRITKCEITNAHSVLLMEVEADIEAKLRPEAMQMLHQLDQYKQYGYNRTDFIRGGGPSLPYPVKRIARWVEHKKEFLNDVIMLWKMPWWYDVGIKKMRQLLEAVRDKTYSNILAIEQDPTLAVGDKRPDTGTGWQELLATREDFGKNLHVLRDTVEAIERSYFDDLISLFDPMEPMNSYPNRCGIIRIASAFKGLRIARRSDIKGVVWPVDNRYTLRGSSREVGTCPASALHNRALDGSQWIQDIWGKIATKRTILPWDMKGYSDIMSAPPLTSDMAAEEQADLFLLNTDFGWTTQQASVLPKWQITKKEDVKFGADNIWMSGIALQTDTQMIPLLISGSPYTMLGYVIMHHAIDRVADVNGLNSVRIRGIGDDFLILGRKEHLAVLYQALTPYLRTKGMSGNIDFITGTYRLFDPHAKWAMFWTQPRFIKSVPSPSSVADVPILHHGEVSDWIIPSQPARLACDDFWLRWKQKIMHQMDLQDIRNFIEDPGNSLMEMRQQMAALGGVSPNIQENEII